MKQLLHDILNAMVGIFRSGESTLSKAIKKSRDAFNELKEKGASNPSETAAKMHQSIDEVINQVNNLGSKAGGAYKSQLAKAEGLYNHLVENIKQLDLKDKTGSVKKKIEELRKAIKGKSKAKQEKTEKTEKE